MNLLPSLSAFFPRLRLPWLLLATLFLASCVGVAMLAARVLYSGRGWHLYLVWNLMLAWMPLGFAVMFRLLDGQLPRLRALRFACACGWLLFLPNAPYIVTDFVHLTPQPPVPLWFDILLLMTFAWTGVMLGFVSLRLMQQCVESRWGARVGWGFAAAALALASFGIYLGRFQRFNSWSVLNRPLEVFGDLVHRVFVPWEHPRTWGFTACCFAFLSLAYLHWAGGQQRVAQPTK
ncbi:MAG: DUF1361 domain-containing protein [Limisphaerales bacterium]